MRLGVTEHRALDLAAAAVGLDDHPRVMASRQLDRLVQPSFRARDLRDPHARPEPRGLHPQRQSHRGRLVAPPVGSRLAELHLGDAVEAEKALEDELVDRQRRRQDARTDVREVQAFEHALHRAVLAERPVQHRKRDVRVEQACQRP